MGAVVPDDCDGSHGAGFCTACSITASQSECVYHGRAGEGVRDLATLEYMEDAGLGVSDQATRE